MNNKKKATSVKAKNAVQYNWKRRPSEIRGYHRTLYMNADNGDYLRVDYNLIDKRVRLYLEAANEGGNPYYSVISNGKVTIERSVSTGRSSGFSHKFHERAEIFSTIPNQEVVRLINRNYNIVSRQAQQQIREQKQKRIDETRNRYFSESEAVSYDRDTRTTRRGDSINIRVIDAIDFIIGILSSLIMYILFQYSFIVMGIVSAFYGIIIGFIDMFLRNRPPLLGKVIFFILAGACAYVYGYYIF